MNRISRICCAFLTGSLLAPFHKSAVIPPVVKAVRGVPKLTVLRLSLLLPKWRSSRSAETGSRPAKCHGCQSPVPVNEGKCSSGFVEGDELDNTKSLQSLFSSTQSSGPSHLFNVNQCPPVYQLIPPGPLITLKNGFVLSGFGRLRSLDRSSTQKEESLRA